MTYEYLQKDVSTYLYNVYFACPMFSSNQKLNRSVKVLGKYPLTTISRHSYKYTCANSPKKSTLFIDDGPTVAEQPTF